MRDLQNIFEAQQSLQLALGQPMDGGSGNIDKGVKENMLALIVEATEVLNEVNWKPWKPELKVIDRDKLLEELVDVLQFWVNAVQCAGFNSVDVQRKYYDKLAVCYGRIKQREEKS